MTPNDHRVWRNLAAALYWAPGERDKAAAAYAKAIELAEKAREVNPRQADLLAQLADAYSMVRREREARDAIAALERLRPDEASVIFTLAVVWEQLGDRDEALAWLEKAIAAGYARERIERSPSLSELRKDRRFGGLWTRSHGIQLSHVPKPSFRIVGVRRSAMFSEIHPRTIGRHSP